MSVGVAMVYGATGFTGGLVVDQLLRAGLTPIVAGRSAGAVADLAERKNLEPRVGDLDQLPEMLHGVDVLLHAAGPFRATASAAVRACISTKTHYLDLSGECESLAAVATHHGDAESAGVMLLPAVGFDVVASDCLIARLAHQHPGATEAHVGVSGLIHVSRGSARTLVRQLGRPARVRRHGRLLDLPPGSETKRFDFGDRSRVCSLTSWGDVVTAWYSTGIPNVSAYFDATPPVQLTTMAGRMLGPWLRSSMHEGWMYEATRWLPEGPTAGSRATQRARVAVELRGDGRTLAAALSTMEVYDFTARSATAATLRVLSGAREPGFTTPSRVFGPDFVLSVPGTELRELDSHPAAMDW